MPKLNHQVDAPSSIDWADKGAAVQIVTAANKQEKAIKILVNEKFQVKSWSSVLKDKQKVDLKTVASILDKAVASSAPAQEQQTVAVDPISVMVIVALTGLLTYTIKKNYGIQANFTSATGWTFTLNLTPSSSAAR
jgi:Ni,Fe-hydrogenase I cytochrome b subunit